MSKSLFPSGWDQNRVKRLIEHYEALTDEEDAAEDNFANRLSDWTNCEVLRRREEIRDCAFGISHDETWRRIANRSGDL